MIAEQAVHAGPQQAFRRHWIINRPGVHRQLRLPANGNHRASDQPCLRVEGDAAQADGTPHGMTPVSGGKQNRDRQGGEEPQHVGADGDEREQRDPLARLLARDDDAEVLDVTQEPGKRVEGVEHEKADAADPEPVREPVADPEPVPEPAPPAGPPAGSAPNSPPEPVAPRSLVLIVSVSLPWPSSSSVISMSSKVMPPGNCTTLEPSLSSLMSTSSTVLMPVAGSGRIPRPLRLMG